MTNAQELLAQKLQEEGITLETLDATIVEVEQRFDEDGDPGDEDLLERLRIIRELRDEIYNNPPAELTDEPTPPDTPEDDFTFEELEEIIRGMPEFSEKTLQTINLRLSTQQGLEEIDSLFELAATQLEAEDRLNSARKRNLEFCREQARSQKYEEAKNSLAVFIKDLTPVNIPLLLKYVNLAKQTAQRIRRKDVYLLLGGTGSGKSTTIQFLMGSRMGVITERGITHIGLLETVTGPLGEVRISPFTKSETRYITSIPIDIRTVPGCADANLDLYLTDSPGFFDTNGPEIDIANSIGIAHALKGAKSLRVGLVLSGMAIGGRYTKVKEMANLLLRMFPRMTRNLKAFEYWYTKFDAEEARNIAPKIRNIIENAVPEDRNNQAFMKVLQDMQAKAERFPCVIDPLNPEQRNVLLKRVKDLKPVTGLSEQIEFFLTEDSQRRVDACLQNIYRLVQNAMKRGANDLIVFLLDQAKALRDVIDQGFAKQFYDDILNSVSQYFHELVRNTNEVFAQYYSPKNSLREEALDQFLVVVDKMKATQSLSESHLGSKAVTHDTLLQTLVEKAHELVKIIDTLELSDSSIAICLGNLKLFSAKVPGLDDKLRAGIEVIQHKAQTVLSQGEQSLSASNYATFAQSVHTLCTASVGLGDDSAFDFAGITEKLHAAFKEKFATLCATLHTNLQVRPLGETEIARLSECFEALEVAKTAYALPLELTEVTKASAEHCFSKVQSLLSAELEDGISLLSSREEEALQAVKVRVVLVGSLMKIKQVEQSFSNVYSQLVDRLVARVNEMRIEAEMCLTKLSSDAVIDYNLLIELVNGLTRAAWVNEIRSGVYTEVVEKLKRSLSEHVNELGSKIRRIRINVRSPNNIHDLKSLIERIEKVEMLDNSVPGIKEACEAAKSAFLKNCEVAFKLIAEVFDLNRLENSPTLNTLDVEMAEASLTFLETCSGFNLIDADVQNAQFHLQRYLREYGNKLKAELEAHIGSCMEIHGDSEELLDKLKPKAFKAARHVRELFKIEETSPQTYALTFDSNDKDQIVQNLRRECLQLQQKMDQAISGRMFNGLKTDVYIAQALGSVDPLIFVDGQSGFSELFKRYQDLLSSELGMANSELIQAVENNQFPRANAILGTMTLTAPQKNNIEYLISNTVEGLLRSLRSSILGLRTDMVLDDVQTIGDKLNSINQSKTHLWQFVPESVMTELSKLLDAAMRVLNKKIRDYINTIQVLFGASELRQAEHNFNHISNIRIALDTFWNADEFAPLLENVEKYREDHILQTVEHYSTLPLKEYLIDPPREVLERLEEAKMDALYSSALNKLKTAIIGQFRKAREEAERDVKHRDEIIKQYDRALNFLPPNLSGILAEERREFSEWLKKIDEEWKEEFESLKASGDPQKFRAKFAEAKAESATSVTNELKAFVVDLAEQQLKSLDGLIAENCIDQVLEKCDELHQLNQECVEYVPSLKPRVDRLLTSQRNHFDSLTKFFRSLKVSSDPATVESSLPTFFQYLESHIGQPSKLQTALGQNYEVKLTEAIEPICALFRVFSSNFAEGIDLLKADTVNQALGLMRQWSAVYTAICNFVEVNQGASAIGTLADLITEVPSYESMTKILVATVKAQADSISKEDLESGNLVIETTRDQVSRSLSAKLEFLREASRLSSHATELEDRDFFNESLAVLNAKVEALAAPTRAQLESERTHTNAYGKASQVTSVLKSLDRYVAIPEFGAGAKFQELEQVVTQKLEKIAAWTKQCLEVGDFVRGLISLKTVSVNLPSFREPSDEYIDELLTGYKAVKGSFGISTLSTRLQEEPSGIGMVIINEHSALSSALTRIWDDKTNQHGVDYVIEHLQGTEINKESLADRYEDFIEKYKETVDENLEVISENDATQLDTIVSNLKKNLPKFDHSDGLMWNIDIRSHIPELLSQLFALWTLSNTKDYNEMRHTEEAKSFLLKPHAAQVIAILRMLGHGYSTRRDEAFNNLVQISTGEGKSVTLAMTAIVLALFGCEVSCVCYSEYLSTRDYSAFRDLFNLLGVIEDIKYGTFNTICEDILNEHGSIRDRVISMIAPQVGGNITRRSSNKPRVLLIDEVDVFFNKDFYGNVYMPVATLQSSSIQTLVTFIWANRSEYLSFEGVTASQEYQACLEEFPNWTQLIEEAVKDMIYAVLNIDSHEYIVQEGKIGYKDQDSVSFDLTYGYNTMFAHFKEHENERISQETLENNIYVSIQCGVFLYSEIPRNFNWIIGVTGTLATLSKPERDVITNEYQIHQETYMPSVFGATNRKFAKNADVEVVNNDDYFLKIKSEIERRQPGQQNVSVLRPVFVFFEDKQKLMEFFQWGKYAPLVPQTIVLTEEFTATEKRNLIRQATRTGQITLFTREFGRGVDFICFNKEILLNGGIHVIQTFLSEEESEEVQIMGRTARQGTEGSYSMVLLDQELEKFQVFEADLQKMANEGTKYDVLHKRRTEVFKLRYQESMDFIQSMQAEHQKSQEFLAHLADGNIAPVQGFLIDRNKGAVVLPSVKRTIVALDATCSMDSVLTKTKNTIAVMFERAATILEENGIDPNIVKLQLVVYRNYNCKANSLLECSSWEAKPEELRKFLSNVKCSGGWGNEAIEVALQHANQENMVDPVSQIIIIGDAAANTPEGVIYKRKKEHGEKYWSTTAKFAQPTNYLEQLEPLVAAQIPIHGFYVNQGDLDKLDATRNSFTEIAQRTGGSVDQLDIESESASQKLIDLVTIEILRSIDQSFAQKYQERFAGRR